MEVIYSSETSVDCTAYIPEVSALHIHHCEDLKSYKFIDISLKVIVLYIIYDA
jgi:hypothetical protein